MVAPMGYPDPDQQPGTRSSPPGASAERSVTTSDPAHARGLAIEAARTLRDEKCEDIVILDVRGLSHVTDYILLGSGSSQRQMASALKHVEERAEQMGYSAFGSAADRDSLWLLADFVDVVVHLFEPNTRAHYDLEMLWGDAEHVPWDTQTPGSSMPGARPASDDSQSES